MSVSSFVKRGTPSAWPDEIKIIQDEADPLYQPERIDLPITDEHIRNFVAVGQVQPIAVRVRGADVEAVDGCQRWKRATVVNAVVGARPYRGKIESVREAIERVKADADLSAWLADRAPSGIKLKFDLFRGKNGEAARAQTSANEMRMDDPLTSKIKRAHRMSKAGFSEADIAEDFGVSVQSAKAWLKKDPDAAPKARKARTKKVKPGPKKLRAAYDHFRGKDTREGTVAATILEWAIGECSTADLVAAFPELKGIAV